MLQRGADPLLSASTGWRAWELLAVVIVEKKSIWNRIGGSDEIGAVVIRGHGREDGDARMRMICGIDGRNRWRCLGMSEGRCSLALDVYFLSQCEYGRWWTP